jgi:hypothetical protein
MMEWISVEDRLPDINGRYIVNHLNHDICVITFSNYGWQQTVYFKDNEKSELGFVTHWMPLPKPPKAMSDKST